VRCPGCGADVSLLREFCPKCGTPTDPGLRESRLRRDCDRSPGELKQNRKTVLIACAAIAGVLAISGKLSWHLPPVHFNLHEPPKGPVVTDAVDLTRAYAADSATAEKKFGGREIAVTGQFLRIVPDGYGSIDMRLKGANPDFPLGVDVVNASVDDAKRLEPGQEVTVSCRQVAGSGNDRWLRDCAIQAEGDEAGPAPPAKPPPRPASPGR
jgi:hypothetical protein